MISMHCTWRLNARSLCRHAGLSIDYKTAGPALPPCRTVAVAADIFSVGCCHPRTQPTYNHTRQMRAGSH